MGDSEQLDLDEVGSVGDWGEHDEADEAVARALCDQEFAIPLYGFSESVNLSVATALVVYTHTTRRRAALGRAGDLDEQSLTELLARYYARDVRGAAAIVRRFAAASSPPTLFAKP